VRHARRLRASLIVSAAGLLLAALALASAQLALPSALAAHASTLLAAAAVAAVVAGAGMGWSLARGVDALAGTPEAASELAARLPGAVTRAVTLAGGAVAALALVEAARHDAPPRALWAIGAAGASFVATIAVAAALSTRAVLRRRGLATRPGHAARHLARRLRGEAVLVVVAGVGPAAALALGAGAPPLVVASLVALAVALVAIAARLLGLEVQGAVAHAASELRALGAPGAPPPAHAAAIAAPASPSVREARELAHAAAQLADRVTQLRLTRRLAVERAHEAERLRTRFLANTSHELRSPLHAVLGYTDLLLRGVDGPLGDAQRASLERIQGAGGHLLHIITEVLDLARIDAGRLDLVRMHAIPAELVEQAIEELRKRFPAVSIEVSTRLGRGLPTLWVDQYRVVQALTYLLTYAVEAVTVGQRRRRARLVVSARLLEQQADGGQGGQGCQGCEISVASPDATLETDEHDRLFDGFRLLTGRAGLGLGPHLARRFVELHGGTVNIAPPGQGVRFDVVLPVVHSTG
jgi:signal transduction histidine kinase